MPNHKADVGENEHINPRFDMDCPSIDVLYVWIAINPETGHEGIIYARVYAQRTPLIATTLDRAMELQRYAKTVERMMHVEIRLVKFDRMLADSATKYIST